ncbi:MAG: tetratricopeptide repeat protein [Proteobacteria bacterium]|nr:tetratricopeptide repeat protein [Pseudomonadota bacterium]
MIKISENNNNCQKACSAKYRILIGIVLFIITFAVYRQVINHEFITFDDNIYVTDNSIVKKGISLSGVLWAFKFTDGKSQVYWHPVTWLSHMLDYQLFDLNAGMHHLTSLLLHAANSILLFYILSTVTGDLWRSAFVAALFALHPVNVDSVAWIAERKNVLSTFFWMLTMLSYVYYTRHPDIIKYFVTILFFVFGLLSKPMLVTLPFALFLFDYWPLERFELGHPGLQKRLIFNIILEKTPFFILSFVSVYLSSVSLRRIGNLTSVNLVPMNLRLENAIVSYPAYIGKMICPSDLSVYYPFPASIAVWKIVASLILLVSVTIYVLFKMSRFRFLGTGWFWFIGTLVPVSGIVQGGLWPMMADRWAYIPYIGLFVIISWGGYELLSKYHLNNYLAAAISITILFALSTATNIQLKYWQDSKSLYKHALEVGPVNPVMLNNMGNVLVKESKYSEAVSYYKEALILKPDYAKAHNNLATAFYKLGRIDDSIRYYSEALRYGPNIYKIHNNFGCVLFELGKGKEAMFHFIEALRINPDYDEAHYNLGLLLYRQGRIEQAVSHYARSVSLNPFYAEAHNNLGLAYNKLGRTGYAVKHYNEALRLDPNMPEAHVNLGEMLFYAGDYDKALSHLRRAAEIKPEDDSAMEKIKTVLEKNEKFQKEEKSILIKIAGKPGDFTLYVNLGDLYVKYKRFDSAEEHYKRAVMISPDNHEGIIKLAKIYAMKGNFSKAISEAERAIKLNPGYAYGYYFIASVYSLLDDKERSQEWLKKAVANGFNNWDFMRSDKNLYNIRNTSYYMDLAVKK